MTEHDELDQETAPEAVERTPMAAWKKVLAVLSLLLGGAGLAMGGASGSPSKSVGERGAGDGLVQPAGFNGTNSLTGSGGLIGVGDPEPEPDKLWAPLLAKGGLSFFIAFCIGYALRTFLKGTMLVIGVVSLALFGLHKAGIVTDIDWSKAQGYWDSLTANVGKQFESFKTFVTGSLPSAASGGVGLVAGFRR